MKCCGLAHCHNGNTRETSSASRLVDGVLVLTLREDVGEWVDGVEIILVLLGSL